MKKEDKRVVKSKMAFRVALFEMLKTTPLEKITISELCKNANSNRMTFYNHFKDINELSKDCVEYIQADLLRQSDELNQNISMKENPIQFCINILKPIFDLCVTYADLFKAIYIQDDTVLIRTIEGCIALVNKKMFECIEEQRIPKFDKNLIIDYTSGGFTNTIFQWIFREERISREELEKQFESLLKTFFDSNLFFFPVDVKKRENE